MQAVNIDGPVSFVNRPTNRGNICVVARNVCVGSVPWADENDSSAVVRVVAGIGVTWDVSACQLRPCMSTALVATSVTTAWCDITDLALPRIRVYLRPMSFGTRMALWWGGAIIVTLVGWKLIVGHPRIAVDGVSGSPEPPDVDTALSREEADRRTAA